MPQSPDPRDWADELAEIILDDALRPEPLSMTLKIIANRLRKVRLDGECRGVKDATASTMRIIDQVFGKERAA